MKKDPCEICGLDPEKCYWMIGWFGFKEDIKGWYCDICRGWIFDTLYNGKGAKK